jgi:hypothetical protein
VSRKSSIRLYEGAWPYRLQTHHYQLTFACLSVALMKGCILSGVTL